MLSDGVLFLRVPVSNPDAGPNSSNSERIPSGSISFVSNAPLLMMVFATEPPDDALRRQQIIALHAV